MSSSRGLGSRGQDGAETTPSLARIVIARQGAMCLPIRFEPAPGVPRDPNPPGRTISSSRRCRCSREQSGGLRSPTRAMGD